jgi:hypothetical protein
LFGHLNIPYIMIKNFEGGFVGQSSALKFSRPYESESGFYLLYHKIHLCVNCLMICLLSICSSLSPKKPVCSDTPFIPIRQKKISFKKSAFDRKIFLKKTAPHRAVLKTGGAATVLMNQSRQTIAVIFWEVSCSLTVRGHSLSA